MDINYSRYGKVYFDYYTFSEDYPELCNLAKKVSSDINSYYDVAIIYGEMKNDNINPGLFIKTNKDPLKQQVNTVSAGLCLS